MLHLLKIKDSISSQMDLDMLKISCLKTWHKNDQPSYH